MLFLSAGILIFWYVYKDLELEMIKDQLADLKYGWIILSFFLGMLSHISRAFRWNMLIETMGYKPRTINTFLSVMVMYLTNLAIPRAGEVARCSMLTKYEKVPFTKLFGTVVVERTTDMIALMVFAVAIFALQYPVFQEFVKEHPEFQEQIKLIFSTRNIILAALVLVVGLIMLYIYRHSFKRTKFYVKIKELVDNLIDGIKTITQLKKTWLYVLHTLFIYLMWLIMLYVVFFSFEPTAHLSILAGMAAFVMSGLAMAAPVQGGIGPWHFMVYETLFIYGIDKTDGKIFALIAHSATNLSLLVVGFIALLLFPVINKEIKKDIETISEEFSAEESQS